MRWQVMLLLMEVEVELRSRESGIVVVLGPRLARRAEGRSHQERGGYEIREMIRSDRILSYPTNTAVPSGDGWYWPR